MRPECIGLAGRDLEWGDVHLNLGERDEKENRGYDTFSVK